MKVLVCDERNYYQQERFMLRLLIQGGARGVLHAHMPYTLDGYLNRGTIRSAEFSANLKGQIMENKMMIAYNIVTRAGAEKSYWEKIGVAFLNKDGSINVKLNSLPINGELQLRVYEEKDGPVDDKPAPKVAGRK